MTVRLLSRVMMNFLILRCRPTVTPSKFAELALKIRMTKDIPRLKTNNYCRC